ncbi:MAG: hypothetical protein GC159_18385 [Phycisphaera sp.]|nr:hypothetical protein [Phycisphaera sp.]
MIRAITVSLVLGCSVLLPASAGLAATVDPIHRDRTNQERARQLTADLLSALLDAHIQQLSDNGLTDLPLYQDLLSMRSRLGELSGQMMPEVIDLLNAADEAKGDEAKAQKAYADARGRMRQILVRLLAERERLRLRRQQAELIERVREIIIKQTDAKTATTALGGGDEQAVLLAMSSQENVGTLYETFSTMLDDVSKWPGELGAIAAEARRITRDAKIADELKGAETELNATKFSDATGHQQKVIDGLARVLTEIRKLEDPAAIDKDVADAVKELIKEQETVREEVKQAKDAKQLDEALKKQTLIQQKLRRLENMIAGSERAADLAERAEESAADARESLFNEESKKAVEDQGRVIGALAELQKELENKFGDLSGTKSAEEYAKLAKSLEETKKQLEKAQDKHQQAEKQAEQNQQQAAGAEKEAAKELDQAAKNAELPPAIASRIRSAEEATAEAAKELSKKSDTAQDAQDTADRAIRQAIGEVAEAQAAAERNADAVKLGELNRSVESLARAAAKAEETAKKLTDGKPETPDQAAEATEDLQKVNDIAQKVAEGTKNLAPQAADALAKAQQSAKQTNQDAPAALKGDEAKQQSAAAAATETAAQLNNAANELRKEMLKTADKLANETGTELNDLKGLEDKVAGAIEANPQPSSKDLQALADDALENTPSVGAALADAAQARAQAENQPQGDQAQGNQPQGNQPQQANANQPQGDKAQGDKAQGDQPQGADANNAQPQGAEANQPQTADAGQPEGADASPQALTDRQLQRARVLADIKREDLEEKLALAEKIKQLAEQGDSSAKELADARDAFEKAQAADQAAADAAQPQGDQPQGDQPQGAQPQGDQPQGAQPQGDQPQADQPQGDQPQGAQPQGDQPQGAQPQGDQPQGAQPQAPQSPAAQKAAQQLANAINKQAESLAQLGEAVSNLTGETGLANQPVAEAVQIASTLTPEQAAGAELAQADTGAPTGDPANADAGQPAGADAGQPAGADQGQPQGAEAGQGQPQGAEPGTDQGTPAAQAGAPAEGQGQGQPQPGQGQGQPSGAEGSNGIAQTPQGAQATAKMMAGAQGALAAALAQAQGQGQGQGQPGEGQGQGQPQPGQGQGQPQPGQGDAQAQGQGQGEPTQQASASSGATGGGTSKGKSGDSENTDVVAGNAQATPTNSDADSRTNGSRPGDADVASKAADSSAWTAGLPQGVRQSMKLRQKSSLPRGYEERLKTYFEALD